MEQPEVVKTSWDQIDYFPERLQSTEGSGLANKKKPKGKGGKKKGKKKEKKKGKIKVKARQKAWARGNNAGGTQDDYRDHRGEPDE